MHTRDATGRQVSLLNDDGGYYPAPQCLAYRNASQITSQPYPPSLSRTVSNSPNTPELLRSNSYDSQASLEPTSPLTPNLMYADYSRTASYAMEARSPYEDYPAEFLATVKRPGSYADSRSNSYEEEASSPAGSVPNERVGKRYPCRYRDSHGCEKTFTTSGHASRHSKIHTAEKAVQCTFSGCTKKFTRADNMKQHLETHFKEKSRSSGSSRPSVGGRRSSSSVKTSSSSSSSSASSRMEIDTAPPLPSPGVHGGAWDMRGLNLPLMSRPSAARTPSGLDTLAMAVACQEGA